jgi:membrane associated rhomboid family serine protease
VGIYDRDYYREERPGIRLSAPRTVVGLLVLVNVAFWLVDFLTPETAGGGRWLSDHMAVHVDTLTQPWLWWQYLTAGFAHSPNGFQHILFNMLALYVLGRDVEEVYGSKEFLRVYLAMVVFASVVWNVVSRLTGTPGYLGAYGASGAIAGVVVLYAFSFPRRMLLLFFFIPIPAWAFGVLVVAMDMFGASGQGGPSNVAYSMHLAGAFFALLYHQFGWNFGRLLEGRFRWPTFRRAPRLRVHEPESEEPAHPDLSEEVDRLLEKIYRQGEASLTPKERKILETASREYQRRARVGDDHKR